jgi:hypothetical protein
MTRHLVPMMKPVGFLALLAGLVAATVGYFEGMTSRRLAREGETAIGHVEGQHAMARWWGEPAYKLRVKYESRDGLLTEREFDVSRMTYLSCTHCDPPEVRYLPADPNVAEIPFEGIRGLETIIGGGIAGLLGLAIVGLSTWLGRSPAAITAQPALA